MIKYRVKKITFKDGSSKFFPQKRFLFFWCYMNYSNLMPVKVYSCNYNEAINFIVEYENNRISAKNKRKMVSKEIKNIKFAD